MSVMRVLEIVIFAALPVIALLTVLAIGLGWWPW